MLQIQLNGQVFTVSGTIVISGPPVPTPPAAPTDLDINDASDENNVILEWTNHAVDATAIEIWRADAGAAAALIDTIAPGLATYTDVTAVGLLYAEYTVRATNAGGNSAFTDTRGIANSLQDGLFGNYSFPTIVLHFGNFTLGLDALSIDMPLLRHIRGSFSVGPNNAFVSLTLPALLTSDAISLVDTNLAAIPLPAYTEALSGGLTFDSNVLLVTLSLPVLTTINGDLTAIGCNALKSGTFTALAAAPGSIDFQFDSTLDFLDFSALVSVASDLRLNDTVALTGANFNLLESVTGVFDLTNTTAFVNIFLPNLLSVGADFRMNGTGATNLSVPSLQTVGDLFGGGLDARNSPNLPGLFFPSLTSINGALLFDNCASILTLSADALTSIGAEFTGSNCANLASMSLNALASTFGPLSFNTNPALVTVSLPVWVTVDNVLIDFSGAALDVGDSASGTGVDGILRRGVVSGVTNCDFELSGGTSATPSASGVTDAGILTGLGNVVNTN